METQSYTTIDKSAWPRGEWDNEPDKVQWQDEATGYPCLAVRGPGGHWCGYVGVPPGHPYHGKQYDDCPAEVHWGLTFSDRCQDGASEAESICHIPGAGEPDDVWWLGSDCAHSGDLTPKWAEYMPGGGVYRTLGFVKAETAQLAEQLASAMNGAD